jgi:hypothetical protein
MCGAVPSLPQYFFMAWCLVKKITETTLPLPLLNEYPLCRNVWCKLQIVDHFCVTVHALVAALIPVWIPLNGTYFEILQIACLHCCYPTFLKSSIRIVIYLPYFELAHVSTGY